MGIGDVGAVQLSINHMRRHDCPSPCYRFPQRDCRSRALSSTSGIQLINGAIRIFYLHVAIEPPRRCSRHRAAACSLARTLWRHWPSSRGARRSPCGRNGCSSASDATGLACRQSRSSASVCFRTRLACAYRDHRRMDLTSCQRPLLACVGCRTGVNGA